MTDTKKLIAIILAALLFTSSYSSWAGEWDSEGQPLIIL